MIFLVDNTDAATDRMSNPYVGHIPQAESMRYAFFICNIMFPEKEILIYLNTKTWTFRHLRVMEFLIRDNNI